MKSLCLPCLKREREEGRKEEGALDPCLELRLLGFMQSYQNWYFVPLLRLQSVFGCFPELRLRSCPLKAGMMRIKQVPILISDGTMCSKEFWTVWGVGTVSRRWIVHGCLGDDRNRNLNVREGLLWGLKEHSSQRRKQVVKKQTKPWSVLFLPFPLSWFYSCYELVFVMKLRVKTFICCQFQNWEMSPCLVLDVFIVLFKVISVF